MVSKEFFGFISSHCGNVVAWLLVLLPFVHLTFIIGRFIDAQTRARTQETAYSCPEAPLCVFPFCSTLIIYAPALSYTPLFY